MEKKVVTKKGHQIFGQEKCTPAEKILANPGYAYMTARMSSLSRSVGVRCRGQSTPKSFLCRLQRLYSSLKVLNVELGQQAAL